MRESGRSDQERPRNKKATEVDYEATSEIWVSEGNRPDREKGKGNRPCGKSYITRLQTSRTSRLRTTAETEKQAVERIQSAGWKTRQPHQETQKVEAGFREGMSEEAKQVQEDKQHEFLLKLAEIACDPDVQVNNEEWRRMLQRGSPFEATA